MTCSNDPHFYQACDYRLQLGQALSITNSRTLCDNFLCQWNGWSVTSVKLRIDDLMCNGKEDCENTDLDEDRCSSKTLPSGRVVSSKDICNDKCPDDCEDEAECNGFTYGIYCKTTSDTGKVNPNYYVHPYLICDGNNNCDNGEDESECHVSNETENVC